MGTQNAEDIGVSNGYEEPVTFDIEVVHNETGEVVIDELRTIEPDEDVSYSDPLGTQETYTFTISDDLGKRRHFEWTPKGESASLSVLIFESEFKLSIGVP
jgi:hypothetical protein